jgi:hypothetical protein
VLRKMVDNDVYRPHTLEEIVKIAVPEVVAWLNSDKGYGVQWFNRQKVGRETISELDGEGVVAIGSAGRLRGDRGSNG